MSQPLRITAAEYLAMAGNGAPRSKATKAIKVPRPPSGRGKGNKGRMNLADVRAIIAEDPSQADPFEVRLQLHPTPKERPRHGGINKKTGKRITYTPSRTTRFERNVKAIVAHEMMLARRTTYRVPILVDFVHVFEGPEDEFPVGIADGDLSNLTKSVEDGLNKTLYVDDGLIMENPRHGKRCGKRDEIIVVVTPVVGPGGRYPRN